MGNHVNENPMTDPEMVVSEASYGDPGLIGQSPPPQDPADQIHDSNPPLNHNDDAYTKEACDDETEDERESSVTDIPPAVLKDLNQDPDEADRSPLPEQMHTGQGHVSAEERQQLLSKLEKVSSESPANKEPAIPSEARPSSPSNSAESTMPAPQMSRRGRGIAYFYRNFIQLGGRPLLLEGNEVFVGDRAYELRPRKIDNRYLIGGGAAILTVIALIVASFIVGGDSTGSGNVVGVVLDEYGQPFLQGASVYHVDGDQQVISNAQGFFEFEELPAGPHEFRLMSGRAVLGRSYATVVGGHTSTLLISPQREQGQLPPSQNPAEQQRSDIGSEQSADDGPGRSKPQASDREQDAERRWASVRVRSNVDNPRLSMDGEVLGKGNSRYVKLRPGRHSYEVRADGYAPASGTIELPAGQTTTLAINLESLRPTREATPTPDDNYLLGTAAASDGDHQAAVERFTDVLNANPDRVEALEARAQSYHSMGNQGAAFKDYLRAGQMRRAAGHVNMAITDFNQAIEIDENSLAAYLGRGDTYLAMKQPFAAVANFDAALEINGNSFDAHYGLGKARYQQRQYERALRHFEDAREIDSQRPGLHQFMMLCYFANDDFDEMQDSYERFMQVASPDEKSQLHNNPQFSALMRVID